MRGLIGFVLFVCACFTLHTAANSRAELRCYPVAPPPAPKCTINESEPVQKRPLECRAS